MELCTEGWDVGDIGEGMDPDDLEVFNLENGMDNVFDKPERRGDVGGQEEVPEGFPPTLDQWKEVAFDGRTRVSFDKARMDLWAHGKNEIRFLKKMMKGLGDTEDGKDSLREKVMEYVGGEDSELFGAFKKIMPKRRLDNNSGRNVPRKEDFCRFMSTFYFTCVNNRSYSKLYEYTRSDTTGLLEPEIFNGILHQMDEFNKGKVGQPRFWDLLQNAFNGMVKEQFIMGPNDGETVIGADDDKLHNNSLSLVNIPLNEECGIKRTRHPKDNINGMTNHVVSYVATGVPIAMAFETTTLYLCFVGLMCGLFCAPGHHGETPNLAGRRVTLNVDRGYLRLVLLIWWLKTGGDLLATVPRQEWFPFTFKAGSQLMSKEQWQKMAEMMDDFMAESNTESTKKQKPELVSSKGPKINKMKTLSHNNFGKKTGAKSHKLTASAYHNGHSSTVAMTVSTKHHERHYDAVLAKPSDLKTYNKDDMDKDDRYMLGFNRIKGQDEENDRRKSAEDDESPTGRLTHAEVLQSQDVVPLTQTQGGAEWWLYRDFSLTSYSADSAIRAATKFVTPDDELREDYEMVLKYANLESLLPGENAADDPLQELDVPSWLVAEQQKLRTRDDEEGEEDEEDEDDTVSAPAGDDSAEQQPPPSARPIRGGNASSDAEEEDNDDEDFRPDEEAAASDDDDASVEETSIEDKVNSFINYYLKSTDTEVITPDDMKAIINSADIKFVSACLIKLGCTKKDAISNNSRNLLYDWTQKSSIERLLEWKSKNEMKAIAAKHPSIKINASLRVGAYRTALQSALEEAEFEVFDKEEQRELALQVALLKSKFMKPLKGDAAKYTVRGQRLEKPLLESFYDRLTTGHWKDSGVEALYRPGLVTIGDERFKRDSADGVVFRSSTYTEDEEEIEIQYAIPCEVKSRVSNNTFVEERNRTAKLSTHARLVDDKIPNVPSYDKTLDPDREDVIDHRLIDVSKPKHLEHLHEQVPNSHELLQCLHHASVYGICSCYFIVGDGQGNVLYSLDLRFPEELTDAYGRIMKKILEDGFKWAHQPGDEVPEIPKVVMDAFASNELKKVGMTVEALQDRLSLWRELNISRFGQEEVKYPVPKVVQFKSFTTAVWCASKGSGDGITYLDDSCQERIGIRTPNNIACARILLNFGVFLHRMFQVAGAKEDLSYPTLSHYRNAASKRTTCKDSLEYQIERWIVMSGQKETSEQKLDSSVDLDEPITIDLFVPPPAASTQQTTRNNANKTPDAAAIMFSSEITGNTPGVGQSLANPNEDHLERCRNCEGHVWSQVVPKNDDKKDCRRQCHVCHRKTNWYCSGCRRYLCPTAGGVIKEEVVQKKTTTTGGKKAKVAEFVKKKLPKKFRRLVPKFDKGDLKKVEGGAPDFVEEHGLYTCYIHAHKDCWARVKTEKSPEKLKSISKAHRLSLPPSSNN